MAADTDDETLTTLSARNWRPPLAGSALAVLIVAGACWLLATATNSLDSLSIVAAGGAGVAGVLWLTGRERWTTLGTLLGVAVAPLAGGLLFAGAAYALIAQLAGFGPQGIVFVALSVGVAAFGAASIPSDSADYERVAAAAESTVSGAILLLVASGALIGDAVRRERGIEPFAALPLPETLPSLFPETTLSPPLGSVLLVSSLALLALRWALGALPVAELLDDRAGDDDAALQRFKGLQSVLGRATIGVVLGIVLVFARLSLGPAYADLWARLPAVVAGLLGALATSPFLRWLAIRLLVVATAVVVGVRLLRRLHRSGVRQHLGKVAILLGVAAALAGGWFGHEVILNVVRGRLESALPGSVATAVFQQIDSVIDYYSAEVVALGLVALGGVTTGLTLTLLRLAGLLRLLPREHSGHALASTGLLGAGGFAVALGAPLPQALGTVVGAIVVWDLGRFGVSLGRDVGRRAPSLPVQFVRVLSALLIGAVTAALGLAATTASPASLATESAAALALLAAVLVTFLASLALAR